MKRPKEVYAVTGYVKDSLAGQLKTQEHWSNIGMVEVNVERGFDEVMMRVNLGDVTEVRTGASIKGETLVQFILRDAFNVETVIRTTADIKGITRLYDPTLQLLIASATAKKITPF